MQFHPPSTPLFCMLFLCQCRSYIFSTLHGSFVSNWCGWCNVTVIFLLNKLMSFRLTALLYLKNRRFLNVFLFLNFIFFAGFTFIAISSRRPAFIPRGLLPLFPFRFFFLFLRGFFFFTRTITVLMPDIQTCMAEEKTHSVVCDLNLFFVPFFFRLYVSLNIVCAASRYISRYHTWYPFKPRAIARPPRRYWAWNIPISMCWKMGQ